MKDILDLPEDKFHYVLEEDRAWTRIMALNYLSSAPTPVDEILRQCHISELAVLMILLKFEIVGRIRLHPGNLVSLLYSMLKDL